MHNKENVLNNQYRIDIRDYSFNERKLLSKKGKDIDYETIKLLLPTITVRNQTLTPQIISDYTNTSYVRIYAALKGELPWLLFLIYNFIINNIDNPSGFELVYRTLKHANFTLKNLENIEPVKNNYLKVS